MAIKKKLVLKIQRFRLKKINTRKLVKSALVGAIFAFPCVLGIAVGAYTALFRNLPSISALEEFKPNIITTIFSDEGDVIGEYAIEKRIQISYEDIPDVLKKAIIATEDPRFYKHHGIDFRGILRAIKKDITIKITKKGKRLHGGSTISQQLAKELFLTYKQTLRRKLKELFLALQIERKYTKEEIMTLYCNQFNLGHGAYGVEAASQLFFDKGVKELSLDEAALIAGIFRGPSVYSPYSNSERTLLRRNHVLNRMVEEGFITQEEWNEAKKKPLGVLPLHRKDPEFAAYFKEEVRKYLEKNYGIDALYKEGLQVYTTLNTRFQKYGEEALVKQLRIVDKRQGWRKDKRNLLEEGLEDLESLQEKTFSSWMKPSLDVGDVVKAVILSAEKHEAVLKIKDYSGLMKNADISWTKTNSLSSLMKRGDVIDVRIKKIDLEKKELLVSLDQEPLVEGAFLALDPHTGQIKAMVGGYSFRRSKWNNATQARRQSGSVIKPVLYTAALENGFTPASIIVDEPTEFVDKWSGEPWVPQNYDQKYKGAVTLRKGLEESRNIVTAKLLEYISPQTGVDYCRKFGITTPVYPYLSLALGAFEIKLIEIVSAFSTFPNKGIRIKPYFITRIEDKDGNMLEEAKVESEEVISPQIACIMTSLLQGVIQRGTGVAASNLDWPLAGKTGTTDDYTDAWFVGFSPSLCAGVWVGHDIKISLGEKQEGSVAALPVWIDFFQQVIEQNKKRSEENGEELVREDFDVPPNLSYVEIDRKTGLLATPFCLWPMKEVFLPGTEPDRFCTYEDHLMVLDYYAMEKKDGY